MKHEINTDAAAAGAAASAAVTVEKTVKTEAASVIISCFILNFHV